MGLQGKEWEVSRNPLCPALYPIFLPTVIQELIIQGVSSAKPENEAPRPTGIDVATQEYNE
jgi:hypothetical protein